MVFLPSHPGQVGGRGGDGPMAQEGGNVLNTGPVIPAKLGRRMAQIVGFEGVQPGPLNSLARSCAEAD